MPVSPSDWRLHGQERYLKGKTFVWKAWSQYREGWDHDHCAFCNARFMGVDAPDILREGYTDTKEYYWICELCFNDFEELCEWKIQ